jgi:hypothetical protein
MIEKDRLAKEIATMKAEDINVAQEKKAKQPTDQQAIKTVLGDPYLMRYIDEFNKEKDILHLLNFSSLVIFRKALIKMRDAEIGKVYIIEEFTANVKWAEEWVDGKTYMIRSTEILDDIKMNPVIEEILQTDKFDVNIYYAKPIGQKKALKFTIKWIGKKGTKEKQKQEEWDNLYMQRILPILNDVDRWLEADRVSKEKKMTNTELIKKRKEKEMEIAKKNLELTTTKTSKELVSLIGKLLKKHNLNYSGYTKLKNYSPEEILVKMMDLFKKMKESPALVAFTNDFKNEI